MQTLEIYRRSTIGMCLIETLDAMVQSGTLSPDLAIQTLVQFDKSMIGALESQPQVKSKLSVKGHLHTFRLVGGVWTFILQDALLKNGDSQENAGRVKIVAIDSELQFFSTVRLGSAPRNSSSTPKKIIGKKINKKSKR
ncbi:transcription initiation factor IIA subunit 2-like [Mercurialis annua]|uniref:transcription initiation factor IIA subunit 2-like n=1 Tax=Mercurialis annua TaxID=3986 RepID=UPI00215EC2A5|nr:transcription initiation factor IIA subunit 2-like [Mercurialis annua]XP_050214148.1 transcription initiation factor IIA subunit 2-like [Mercurialis annua]